MYLVADSLLLMDKLFFFQDNLPPAVLVVGDHGMAEGGGHGGATLQEVLVPLVVLSPAFDTPVQFFNNYKSEFKKKLAT